MRRRFLLQALIFLVILLCACVGLADPSYTAMQWIAGAASLTIVVFYFVSILQKGSIEAFRSGWLVLMTFIVLVLQDPLLLQNGVKGYPPTIGLKTLTYVILYLVVFVFIYALVPRPRMAVNFLGSLFGQATNLRISPTPVTIFIGTVFLLHGYILLSLARFDMSVLIDNLLLSRASEVLNTKDEGKGTAASTMQSIVVFFASLIPAMSALVFRLGASIGKRVLLFGINGIWLILLALKGSRGPILYSLFQVVGILVLTQGVRHFMRYLVAGSLGAMILVPLMEIMLRVRAGGWSQIATDKSILAEDMGDYVFMHHDNNFAVMENVVQYVPDVFPHEDISRFLSIVFLNWVPRFLWQDKPIYTLEMVAPVILPWTSQSIVGDMYWIGGEIAIVIGAVVHGTLCVLWDTQLTNCRRSPPHAVLFLLGNLALALTVRAAANLVITAYVLLAARLVFALSAQFGGRRPVFRRSPGGRGGVV